MNSERSNWKHSYRILKRQKEREEFAEWSQDDFIDHILEARKEFDALQKEYELLKAEPKPVIDIIPVKVEKGLQIGAFNPRWPYSMKFVFLMKFENRPLKSIEIHNHLLKLDRQYKLYSDPKSTLSVYLRAMVKSGRIKAIKMPGIKEMYFAIPEWVDKNGNLNEEFNYVFNLF